MKLLRITEIAQRSTYSTTVRAFLLEALCLVTLLVSTLGVSLANAASYVSVDRYWQTTGGSGSTAGGFTDGNWSGRWEWSSQTGDVSICSTSGRGGCLVVLCLVRFKDRGTSSNSLYCGANNKPQLLNIMIPNGTTAVQAQQIWAGKYGTSGSWQTGPWAAFTMNSSSCFAMILWPDGGGFSSQFGNIFPGGSSCGQIPPPNLACTTSGKVTIDYGTLSSGQLNGATASTTLSFTCNQAATATIKLNDSVIDLGRKGDLTAAISIGGKDLASGSDVAVKSGTVTTTITSTLKAKGTPAAGAFEGSGVLIIGYQ